MEALLQSLASIYSESLECFGGTCISMPAASLCPQTMPYLRKSAKHCPSPPDIMKTTPTGDLNYHSVNRHIVFLSLCPISSLEGWKIIWECFNPLSLGFFLFSLILSYLDFFISWKAYWGAETFYQSTGTELTQNILYLKYKG